jgi:fucose 4-O-acetylase-like acetyltransferase
VIYTSDLKNRQKWIDIAKGLGIIAVAAGHSGFSSASYLYWFHMPLFFIISGYLFKPPEDWLSVFNWSARRTCQLLLPYLAFLAIIVVVEYYLGNKNLDYHKIADSFAFNFYPGGRYTGGFYVIFWFITCLYTTQIVFALLRKAFKTSSICLVIIGIAFLLVHYAPFIALTNQVRIPWNIDVALFTLTYYAFGYFARNILVHLNARVSAASIAVTAVLVLCGAMGLFKYSINLKYGTYSYLILDLTVPIVISTALFAVSQIISSFKASYVLALLGKYSLPIMYLHLPVNIILHNYYNYTYGALTFVLIGLAAPALLAVLIFERFRLTKILLLGHARLLPVPEIIFSWRKDRGTAPAAIKIK